MCEHLLKVENYIKAKGIQEVFRGRPWGKNCREWVYFNCILDTEELKIKLELNACVETHEYSDSKVANELGLFCTSCRDGIMGVIPETGHTTDKILIR